MSPAVDRDAPPAARPAACEACHGTEVRAVVRTSYIVYVRCSDCGYVWSVPREAWTPRPDDALLS